MSRPSSVLPLSAALELAARLPLAIGRFDIRASQPQPPGHPLFGLETRVRLRGAAPLRLDLPAAARIVCLLNPRADFYRFAEQSFTLAPAGSLSYTTLPQTSGWRIPGEYELAW
jgi:hypothetical protein